MGWTLWVAFFHYGCPFLLALWFPLGILWNLMASLPGDVWWFMSLWFMLLAWICQNFLFLLAKNLRWCILNEERGKEGNKYCSEFQTIPYCQWLGYRILMSMNIVEINGLISMLCLKCLWMESASLGQQITISDYSLEYEEQKKKSIVTSLVSRGFPGSSAGKESTCNAGDLGLIPGLGRSPGEGNGYPLQYSCLENPMDRGAWQATVHGVTKSRTRLNDFHPLVNSVF